MPTGITRKLFTADEFYRMAEAGILGEDQRVELIDGEIIEMSPVNQPHMSCVNRATELFVLAFGSKT